ncbi:hypothetical protein B9Y78_07995 [Stenotrophomonas maltophilia]|uniref:hypothetical protein n=1 Tax=Stenotrophomonas maltophilia TaxID=40324 RepID=UPI000C2689E9|nr:hypothetical protein [Stenotrophomonas maltophilia]PJL41038.1 hypothetical protein B9Y78_07995 [Stenotrophomonas maltophilia]
MTTSVDVLAVVDELIDFEERHAEYEPRQNHEAREARAAVAELIERIEAALRGECQYFVLGTDGIQIREVRITKANLDSLKAALARVKGA